MGRSGYNGVAGISGGTGSFTVVAQSNLPPGLSASIAGASVVFTGTPSTAGTYGSASVTVQDATGATAASTFSITINTAPTLGGLSSSAWTVSQPGYSGAITISGGTSPFSGLSATGLPAGVTASLSGNTITLGGTPTATGTYGNVAVAVHDAAGATATSTFSITINPAATLGAPSATAWTVNQPGFSSSITISGGTGPFGSLNATGLPSGVSASLSGNTITVSGTPTTAGTYGSVHLAVVDAAGVSSSGAFSITINASPALGR